MIHDQAQNWRTSSLPWSLALRNTVNTGTSFDTSSGAVGNSKFWATRGMQGHGPITQYPGAGMDGLGCGCGCAGKCGCGGGMSGLTFDGTGLLGTGLFGTSPWDWGEWAAIGLGAYMVLSTVLTTRAGAGRVRRGAKAFKEAF